MTDQLVDQRQFHRLAAAGQARGVGVEAPRSKAASIVGDAATSRVVRFVLSDGSIDRMRDRISPTGWDTSAFEKNPVVLFAHDSSAPPVGRLSNVHSDGTKLLGDVKFAEPEIYDFADTIFKLVKNRYLSAGSVGFIPTKYEYSSDPSRPNGIDFLEQELLEFSICPVPANGNALVAAQAKRFGAPRSHLLRLGVSARSNIVALPPRRISLERVEAMRRVASLMYDRNSPTSLKAYLAEMKRISGFLS